MTSPITGEVNEREIAVSARQIAAWQGGMLIQDAMPHLTPAEREFLISGCTEEDWKKLFPPEEEVDDNG